MSALVFPFVVYALHPLEVIHLLPFPEALMWIEIRSTLSVPFSLQTALALRQRSLSVMSFCSGTRILASRPRAVRRLRVSMAR